MTLVKDVRFFVARPLHPGSRSFCIPTEFRTQHHQQLFDRKYWKRLSYIAYPTFPCISSHSHILAFPRQFIFFSVSPLKGLWLSIVLLNSGFLEYTSLADRAIGYSHSFICSMFPTTSRMLLHPLLLIFNNSLGAASPTKNIVKRVDLPADISAWSAFGDSYASGFCAVTIVKSRR